ncbi:cupin domain-containing protein [Tahibacter amnicola]|uniref:Cupin domain-containing protein n=1 Tax=Tahibacter amnicola TaxID=2976241 RepID=A0ABY6BGK3_9GAMM|nr:cupin domain-containing protein [Tahibacter amnicola]UXI67736.1 cupin domain-containing protein [Tahibacter amnicola]
MNTLPDHLAPALGAMSGHDANPWVQSAPGNAFKPLRFLAGDRGFVELMRLDPGIRIPLHRHTGEVHAFTLSGRRQLGTGEVIGPGHYVHEPVGNTDSWATYGDEPVTIFLVVTGEVHYLDVEGRVTRRISAATQRAAYLEDCRLHGRRPLNLESE